MSDTEYDVQEVRPEEATTPVRPGNRLRQAREAKRVSREEVAAELRLHKKLIAALEEDDDANLPPPAFVVGYLRSYSRLLDLPENEVVEAYERHVRGEDPEIVSRVKDAQVTSRDLPVRMVTWLILIGLSALLVLWWISRQPVHEAAPPGAADTVAEAPTAALPPPVQTERAEPELEPAPTTEPAMPRSEAETLAPTADAFATEAPDTTPAAEPSATRETVRLEFEADSWTEVTDSTGQQLIYDLVRAGGSLELSGEPPFKLFFGYAPGVAVYYQGDRIDLRPFTRRDVARFTLGRRETD